MTALSDLLNDAKGDRNIDLLIEAAEERGHMIDRGTVYRALAGEHAKRPREQTLTALSEVFGLDVRKVREAADRPAGELGPWDPTPESAQLDRDQRAALDRLIKTIVQGGQAHGNAAATNEDASVTRIHPKAARKPGRPPGNS